jgi:hypothetical protein
VGFGIKMRACREGRRERRRKDDSGMLAACMEFGMKMDKVRLAKNQKQFEFAFA